MGASGAPQSGQSGSKRPAARSPGARGRGGERRRVGATVGPLAVDDHAAGEHQPAGEPRWRRASEEHGGGEIVVADVVGDVWEIDAESDHRRLVGDPDHALERALEGIGIADIAMYELGPGVELGRDAAAGGGEQRVEDADVMSARRGARRRRASR